MANITDKELLAICNLSNLKMEFANLKFIEPDTKILSNHTIYSLLNAETSSIKNKKDETRVFYKEVLEDDKNKDRGDKNKDRGGVKTPIYENIIDLKKKQE